MERLITKDIQSKELLREELGDSCKILELMKFFYLLKDRNIKNFFGPKQNKDFGDKNFGIGTTSISNHQFKSMFVSSKIDKMLRRYLLTRYHSSSNSKKDEALIEFVQHFPMMYAFKTRILFFKLTSFSGLRNKYYASELFTRALTRDEGGISISRRKLRIPRDNILEDAFSSIKELQAEDSFLEFQFDDEVGTGLGPTLEYYALIGKAIKEEPGMWKETTDNTLYPNPLNFKKRTSKEKKKIEKFFELVGTIVARSLMDERLIDLPISVVFWKLVFAETAILDDVDKIDKHFYKGLKMIQDMIDKKEQITKDPVLPSHLKEHYMKLEQDPHHRKDLKVVQNIDWD